MSEVVYHDNPYNTPDLIRRQNAAVNSLRTLSRSFASFAEELSELADTFDSCSAHEAEAFIAAVMQRMQHVPHASNVINEATRWVTIKGHRAAEISHEEMSP